MTTAECGSSPAEGKLPENQKAIVLDQGPVQGSQSGEIAEALYLLKLGLRTNLRWLERDSPNVDAAVQTSTRMCQYVELLEQLISEHKR